MLGTDPNVRDIDCIFCDEDAPSSVEIRENGFDGRQCHRCGLIFVSPRPTLDEIINIYGHGEAHVPVESHLASGFSKRLYARNSLRILRRYKQSGDILEIGAGAGFFLDEARKQGFNPFAIEFNPSQAAYISGALDIPCEAKPLSSRPFPGQSFDVVYHCDVISHFYDPFAEFRAFHEALREGGMVVFETGNLGDVDHRYFRCFEKFQYPDHLFFFSTQNIRTLLEATGFELLAVHRYAVLLDLWTTRMRNAIRHVFGRKRRSGRPMMAMVAAHSRGATPRMRWNPQSFVRWLKAADQYLNYFIRYRIGGMMPCGSRPQTLIVVARKVAFRHE